jgi:aspartate carbamoyltransferase catalytic subunit
MHVLSTQQFNRETVDTLLANADALQWKMEKASGERYLHERQMGRILSTLFYEPSRVTRDSFCYSAARLGMEVVAHSADRVFLPNTHSQTLEHDVKLASIHGPLAIVLRHKSPQAAERAAAVSSVPIINAGNDQGDHPTKALQDLYTLQRHDSGQLGNHNVLIGGDLDRSGSAQSFAHLLSLYDGNKITYTPSDGAPQEQLENIDEALASADVLYWSRSSEKLRNDSVEGGIGQRIMERLNPKALVLSDVPRGIEAGSYVDNDARADRYDRVRNGMFVRMSLLEFIAES